MEASGRQVPAKPKEKLSNDLRCQSTEGCQVVSCLSREVFKHGVLCWAGADQGDLRESFLSQGLCRYPAVSFSWGRQGPAGHEHCSLALHGLTPARLRCVDGAGGTWLFCLGVLYPALGLPIRPQGP